MKRKMLKRRPKQLHVAKLMFPKTSNTLTLVNYVRYVVKSQLSIPVIASGILENHAVVFLLEVLHAMLSRYITQNETEIQSD